MIAKTYLWEIVMTEMSYNEGIELSKDIPILQSLLQISTVPHSLSLKKP